MILLTVFLEIILTGLMILFFYMAEENYDHEFLFGGIGLICLLALFVVPIGIGNFHGSLTNTGLFKNAKEAKNRTEDTQRQEQDLLKTYYKVEVEYLTNTPTQSGMITNYNIEKDTFYCYITNKELVNKLKENMYKELWIISGHKGGYENYKDFGTKLIKNIELIEEEK